MERNFVFQIHEYDAAHLLPQIERALENRTERLSRARYPSLWGKVDTIRAATGGQTRSRTRKRVLGVLYLLLGIFLFVPGVMDPPELLLPLLMGAVGIVYGVCNLWSARKKKPTDFARAAENLLIESATATQESTAAVTFSDAGMLISDHTSGEECVPYDSFESVSETDDAFLLVFDSRVMVLQKTDLTTGRIEAFSQFLQETVSEYHNLMEQ